MFKYVLKVFFKHHGAIILSLMTVLSFLIVSITPYLNGTFIDFLVNNKSVNKVVSFAIIIMVVNISSIILSFFTNILSIKVISITSFEILDNILKKLEFTKLKIIEKLDSSYLTQRIITDVNNVTNFVISNFILIITNALIIIAILILYCILDKNLLIVTFILMIPYIVLYVKIKNPMKEAYRNRKEADSNFFSKVHSQINQIFEIQLNVKFKQSAAYLKKLYADYLPPIMQSNKILFLFTSFDSIISAIFQSVMFIYGGIEILYGRMSIGQFTMINTYFSLILKMTKYYINTLNSFQESKVSYERILTIEKYEKIHYGDKSIHEVHEIEINDLNFAYNDDLVFNCFNYKFNKKGLYIVSGKNGSGKSTLLKILTGLYTEYQGTIYFNGENYKDLNLERIRELYMSVVPQRLYMNDCTIKEFIATNLHVKSDKIISLLESELGIFGDEIKLLLDKKSDELSGGELEKVYLWIAFNKNKSILILDEPTTALDKQSREYFIKYISFYSKDKLVIIISHDQDLLSYDHANMINLGGP